jgi:hypothetical protein
MKRATKRFLTMVALSALAIGTAPVMFAAGWQGMGPGMGGHHRMMGGPGIMGMGPGMGGGSVAATSERLADVRRRLGVTAAQEDAWDAYAQAVINRSALMNAHRESMMSGSAPPSGEERLAMHQQGARMAQEAAQASRDLYRVLTPRQRATADNLLRYRHGPGMGM